MRNIKKVAVLGSGVMGSGIAAHVANAGYPVALLDLDQSIAEQARDGLFDKRPAPLMSPEVVEQISVGSLNDDIDMLADCDLIIEAVVENLAIKQQLFADVDKARKQGSIVASNTSGILLSAMTQGMSDAFRREFVIAHFFNPPRQMGLLELVYGPDTAADVVDTMRDFCGAKLGKEVVECGDSSGFVGNRIGITNMIVGVHKAIELGLTPEEADAVAGRPMGFPRTGVFGLMDLIGFDVVKDVCDNLKAHLPDDDPCYQYWTMPNIVQTMMDTGLIGRKAGGGFSRIAKSGGEKVQHTFDLNRAEYRDVAAPDATIAKLGLIDLIGRDDKYGRFAWAMLSQTLSYCASLVPSLTDDIVSIDTAMREGFSWRQGPFELLDVIGPQYFVDRLVAEDRDVPQLLADMCAAGQTAFYQQVGGVPMRYRNGDYEAIRGLPGSIRFEQIKRGQSALFSNTLASVWDMGEGVVGVEMHGKMNTLDPDMLDAFDHAVDIASSGEYKALVIGTDGKHFSAGANLNHFLEPARAHELEKVDHYIDHLQQSLMRLKYAPFPVVAAGQGVALGGGCELMMHCDAVQAHAEMNIGLVETDVGLIPAGGGCKETLVRSDGVMDELALRFQTILTSQRSTSALDAKRVGLLRGSDRISMHAALVLADAKALALSLVEGYHPPSPDELTEFANTGFDLMQQTAHALKAEGKISEYTEVLSSKLAFVLSGGEPENSVSEQQMLDLEREIFLELLEDERTLARIEHMLTKGKPLHN